MSSECAMKRMFMSKYRKEFDAVVSIQSVPLMVNFEMLSIYKTIVFRFKNEGENLKRKLYKF